MGAGSKRSGKQGKDVGAKAKSELPGERRGVVGFGIGLVSGLVLSVVGSAGTSVWSYVNDRYFPWLDSQPPVIKSARLVKNATAVMIPKPGESKIVSFDVVASDNVTGREDLVITAAWSLEDLRHVPVGNQLVLNGSERPGSYTVAVKATDKAGNSAVESVTFFLLAEDQK